MRVSVLFGTRPETIKMAPFILAGRNAGHQVKVIFTGQHRDMALPVLDFFKIKPNFDLSIMRPNQSLDSMSGSLLSILGDIPDLKDTDALVVQGDTTSAFIGAYWAFLNKIPVIHLEAGLRTLDLSSPFPEEANRQLISRVAKLHFAPTQAAMNALQSEGIIHNAFQIGNTGIDAIRIVASSISQNEIPQKIATFTQDKTTILVTSHRRENFGDGMRNIAEALKKLASEMPDVRFVFPVHLNPNVQQIMKTELNEISNVLLTQPLDYLPFVALMKRSQVILTDSGGIQEEAPTLRVPVIVMRDTTERPEGIQAGFAKLVGTDAQQIYFSVKDALQKGCQGIGENPYGDGFSSEKAWKIITQPGVVI